jgi:hypothetical protein
VRLNATGPFGDRITTGFVEGSSEEVGKSRRHSSMALLEFGERVLDRLKWIGCGDRHILHCPTKCLNGGGSPRRSFWG